VAFKKKGKDGLKEFLIALDDQKSFEVKTLRFSRKLQNYQNAQNKIS